jgi:hypothetical protein
MPQAVTIPSLPGAFEMMKASVHKGWSGAMATAPWLGKP